MSWGTCSGKLGLTMVTLSLALLGACQVRNPQWVGKAVSSFQRAIELDPDNPDLHVELGQAFEEQDLDARARDAYDKALELMPGHPEATEGLGRLRAAKKKPKKAAAQPAPAPAAGTESTPKKGFFKRLFGR